MVTAPLSRRLISRSEAWLAAGLLLLSLALGFAAASGLGTRLVAVVSVSSLVIIGLRRRWGAAVCLAPVFLFPITTMTSLPASGPLKWRFILAFVSALFATCYWRAGARRPALNPWSLAAVGFLGIALLILGERTRTSIQISLSLPLYAYSGLIIGHCLVHPKATRAVGYFVVPIAVLAILEAAGVHSLWANLVHANVYTSFAEASNASRSTATFGHPLIAGACLTATGLLLLTLRKRSTTILALVILLAAVTTVSRSTLLAAGLGVLIFALQAGLHRIRVIAIAIVLVIAVIVAINSIPSLRTSFDNRVSGLNQTQLVQQQKVRNNSLSILHSDFDSDPSKIILGGGAGYSVKLLTERGGNAAGYDIFDNEYVTMLYDGGLIVVLIVLLLLATAAKRSSKLTRRQALPALAAIAVVMYFVDGMEWPSLSVAAWMAIGFFTAPALARRRVPAAISGSRPEPALRLNLPQPDDMVRA